MHNCTLFVFFRIFLYIFLKKLIDKGIHQCELFSHEELNIKNVILSSERVFLVYNHDS